MSHAPSYISMIRALRPVVGRIGVRSFSTKLSLQQTLNIVNTESTNAPSDFIANLSQIINAFRDDTSQGHLLGGEIATQFFHRMATRLPTFSAEEVLKTLALCARVGNVPVGNALYERLEATVEEYTVDQLLQIYLLLSSVSIAPETLENLVQVITDAALPKIKDATSLSSAGLLSGLVGLANLGYKPEELLHNLSATAERLESQGQTPITSLPSVRKVAALNALATLESPTLLAGVLVSQLAADLPSLTPLDIADVLQAAHSLGLNTSFSLLTGVAKRINTDASAWSLNDLTAVLAALQLHQACSLCASPIDTLAQALDKHQGGKSYLLRQVITGLLIDPSIPAPKNPGARAALEDVALTTASNQLNLTNSDSFIDTVRETAKRHGAQYVSPVPVSVLNDLYVLDVIAGPSTAAIEQLTKACASVSPSATEVVQDVAAEDSGLPTMNLLVLPSFESANTLLRGLEHPVAFASTLKHEALFGAGSHLDLSRRLAEAHVKMLGVDLVWVDVQDWADALPVAEGGVADFDAADASLLEALAKKELITFDIGNSGVPEGAEEGVESVVGQQHGKAKDVPNMFSSGGF